jgi:hypothetical protein
MSEPSAAAATTPPDNASMAEDFIDIFVSPAKVFSRRAKASPFVPYLVICVVMIVLFFAGKNALGPIIDAEIQKSMEQSMKANPQLTQDMVDKSKPMMAIGINIAGVIGVPILLLILALVLWIVGRFFMSSALTFGTALLIIAYSKFPGIIGGVVGLVEGLTMDVTKMTSHLQLTVSAARFFDPATMSTGLYTLLGQIDLFEIWSIVLIVIGLMYAGKLDKSKATATGVIMFVCACIPGLWALLTGK